MAALKRPAKAPSGAAAPGAAAVLKMLERDGSAKFRADMAPRYGIVARKAYGTPMAKIKAIAKACGRDHALADALWQTGVYEGRLLASMVDEPEKVTVAQMDRWAKEFENWGDCDTLCFNLFDRTPHALGRVRAWAKRKDEFVKRAAFALLASVALHRKDVADEELAALLPLIETSADDPRNFVKKGVSWALRSLGRRKTLRAECVALAERLAASSNATERWVGKDALPDLTKR